jgi:hypothetical protein
LIQRDEVGATCHTPLSHATPLVVQRCHVGGMSRRVCRALVCYRKSLGTFSRREELMLPLV